MNKSATSRFGRNPKGQSFVGGLRCQIPGKEHQPFVVSHALLRIPSRKTDVAAKQNLFRDSLTHIA